jgi:hypothetical protein
MSAHAVVPNGILFSANGKTYISLYQHRGNGDGRHKHMWNNAFSPASEHGLFCTADGSGWQDATGHFWVVYNSGVTIIGERGEILSKFPANANANANVPWHGLPENWPSFTMSSFSKKPQRRIRQEVRICLSALYGNG